MGDMKQDLAKLRYRAFGNAISIPELLSDMRYRLSRKLVQGMQIPMPELWLTAEVFDAKGNRTYKLRRRSHSWNRNAYNYFFGDVCFKNLSDSTFGAGLLSMKDVDGNIIYSTSDPITRNDTNNYDIRNSTYGLLANSGDDTLGIVIGTDDTAEDFEDYALGTQIPEGTGSGPPAEMSHVASELHSISYASLVLKDTLIRYFNNNSGGSITVNEMAIYVGLMKLGVSLDDFMIARDKLSSGIAVGDTAQFKATMEISLTYPS